MYGIVNCTAVRKARNWLEENNIDYTFHDYKLQGIGQTQLQKWCDKFGWQTVLNKSGLMWKKSSAEDRLKVVDEKSAIEFMVKVPRSIKRPIIEHGETILKGFDEAEYSRVFAN